MGAAYGNAILMGVDGRIPDKETPDIVTLEEHPFDLRDAIVIIGDMTATHLHMPAGSAVIATGIISCGCGD